MDLKDIDIFKFKSDIFTEVMVYITERFTYRIKSGSFRRTMVVKCDPTVLVNLWVDKLNIKDAWLLPEIERYDHSLIELRIQAWTHGRHRKSRSRSRTLIITATVNIANPYYLSEIGNFIDAAPSHKYKSS